MSEDPELRDRFAALRKADATRSPAFHTVLERESRPSPRLRWLAATATSLCLAFSVIAYWASHHHSRQATLALSDWRSPTDFLLATPAIETLHAIPEIGNGAPSALDFTLHLNDGASALHTPQEHL